MFKIALLVNHELKLLFKDRQALGLLFVMPLVFIVFLTLALQDVYLAKVGKKVQLEFVGGPQCESKVSVCAGLLAELKRMQFELQVTEAPTFKAQMTVILPERVENTVEMIKQGRALETKDKVQLVFDPTLDQSLRALVDANIMIALQSVMIDQIHREMKDVEEQMKARGLKLDRVTDVSHVVGLIEERAVSGSVLPNPIQQTVPAWSLFGMFFIVIPMANSMLRDRKLGVFKRLLSFPVSRGQLLAGKILPFAILNILQFALMFGVGVFLLPKITSLNLILDFSLWSVLAVTVACAFVATSYGLMVSCLTRTAEQASAFGALSVVILAIMGGVMIPRFVMPEFMQKVSLLSPLYWGLEAYLDIIVRKMQFQVAAGKISVLFGFGLAFLLVARMRFRWSEAE